jgi:hypothetical protein
MDFFKKYEKKQVEDIDSAFDAAEANLLECYNKQLQLLQEQRRDRKESFAIELSNAMIATVENLKQKRQRHHAQKAQEIGLWFWSWFYTGSDVTNEEKNELMTTSYAFVDVPVPPNLSSPRAPSAPSPS